VVETGFIKRRRATSRSLLASTSGPGFSPGDVERALEMRPVERPIKEWFRQNREGLLFEVTPFWDKVVIAGNTYPYRQVFKEMGCWYVDRKWECELPKPGIKFGELVRPNPPMTPEEWYAQRVRALAEWYVSHEPQLSRLSGAPQLWVIDHWVDARGWYFNPEGLKRLAPRQ